MTNGEWIKEHLTYDDLAEYIENGGDKCDFCSHHPCICDHECFFNILEWLNWDCDKDD